MFKIRQNTKLHKSNLFPCCNINTDTNSKKIKVIRNYNAYNVPQDTQVQRTVDTILYSLGGRIQYGYRQPQRRERIVDCNLEGQPTVILAPLKNKF